MCQNLGAVNATPLKGVVGHLIKLVPCQLGGHEIVNAALCHNLGQCAGVTKDIGQPQDAVVHAKFFFEELFPIQELANQTFAAGQVAVSLDPHAAFRLPAPFGNALLDLLVQLGITLLQKVVQLGLTGHELIVRVLLHQLEYRGKAAADLLAGLGNRPPPCHIDVGMPDAAGNDLVMPCQIRVQRFGKVSAGSGNAPVEALVIRGAQVDEVHGLVQHIFQIAAGLAVLLQSRECLQRHDKVVVQPFDFRVNFAQVNDKVELGVQDAGVALQFQAVGASALRMAVQQDVAVVHIDTLRYLAIDKQQELRVLRVVPFVDLGADVHPQRFAVHLLRHGHIGAEPVVLIGTVPVHRAAVKWLEGGGVSVRVLRAQEVARLDEPVARLELLLDREFFQLCADAIDALIQKIDRAHRSIFLSFKNIRDGFLGNTSFINGMYQS